MYKFFQRNLKRDRAQGFLKHKSKKNKQAFKANNKKTTKINLKNTKKLSKKQKTSINGAKSILRITKLHEKIVNQKTFLHKVFFCFIVIYKNIAIENLLIKDM